MPNFLLAVQNKLDKESVLIIESKTLKASHGDSISDWVNKELKSKSIVEGDVIYELRPVLKIENKVVATKLKTL